MKKKHEQSSCERARSSRQRRSKQIQQQTRQSCKLERRHRIPETPYEKHVSRPRSIDTDQRNWSQNSSPLPAVPTVLRRLTGKAATILHTDPQQAKKIERKLHKSHKSPIVIDLTQESDGEPGDISENFGSRPVSLRTCIKTDPYATSHGHLNRKQKSRRFCLERSTDSRTSNHARDDNLIYGDHQLETTPSRAADKHIHHSSRAGKSTYSEIFRGSSQQPHANLNLDPDPDLDFPSLENLIGQYQDSLQGSSPAHLPSVGTTVEDGFGIDDTSHQNRLETRIAAAVAKIQATDNTDASISVNNPRRRRRPWANRELEYLIDQVDCHGAAWQMIWEQNRRGPRIIHPRRTPTDYKDKAMIYKRDKLM